MTYDDHNPPKTRISLMQPLGSSGAKDEVLLTAMAQNLRRLAKFLCRAPPAPLTCTVSKWGARGLLEKDQG